MEHCGRLGVGNYLDSITYNSVNFTDFVYVELFAIFHSAPSTTVTQPRTTEGFFRVSSLYSFNANDRLEV